jgi:SNF family Na+-dependent transporter
MITAFFLQTQTLPTEFFTLQSMLTLTGATGVVFVVSNGLQRVFNYNPKWMALLIAEVIAIIGVILTKNYGISDFFVGIVNGFLIYSTAIGANQMTGTPQQEGGTARGHILPKGEVVRRKFNSKWF